jgi:hypothetical protein
MFDVREFGLQPLFLRMSLFLLLGARTGLVAGIAGRIFFTFFFSH